jgi:hypothetical protein
VALETLDGNKAIVRELASENSQGVSSRRRRPTMPPSSGPPPRPRAGGVADRGRPRPCRFA